MPTKNIMIFMEINFKNKRKTTYLIAFLMSSYEAAFSSLTVRSTTETSTVGKEGHTSELAVQFRKNLTDSLQHINTKVSMQNFNQIY
jgi:hypothetical protein